MIVQELNSIQSRHGYLRPVDLMEFSKRSKIPLYRLQEVASFFPHFRTDPPSEVEIGICRDMSCRLRGATQLCEQLAKVAEDDPHRRVRVEGVSCLGRCDRAPAVRVNEQLYLNRSAAELRQISVQFVSGSPPPADHDADLPATDHWQIDVYEGEPRYESIRQYISNPAPDKIISALETAGLLGMGGAGGRAYKKWKEVMDAAGERKYVVCNADESEPGTFKDRELLLRTPHLILEGMILAGLVVGATRGYVYIRHEYEEQIDAVRAAIVEARRKGVCGSGLLGSDYSFEIDVFVSPGGYICGEQTALIEAMEDKRAEPRNRPPALQTNGLWDMPTLLNNVETFAWVPAAVLKEDGQWFASQGADGCRGRRFFSISGDVRQPGAYEVPSGITLRELVYEHAGGLLEGQRLRAVALSGPSGGILPASLPRSALKSSFAEQHIPPDATHFDLLEMRLDIPTSRQMGLMLGAGIVVYGDQADILDQVVGCLQFFRNESCGKCVPCRIGSQKMAEMAERLAAGGYTTEDFGATRLLVDELASTMQLTSICGLGEVAPNPMQKLTRFFADEVDKCLR